MPDKHVTTSAVKMEDVSHRSSEQQKHKGEPGSTRPQGHQPQQPGLGAEIHLNGTPR